MDKQPQPKTQPPSKPQYSKKAQQQLALAYKNLPVMLRSLMDPSAKA